MGAIRPPDPIIPVVYPNGIIPVDPADNRRIIPIRQWGAFRIRLEISQDALLIARLVSEEVNYTTGHPSINRINLLAGVQYSLTVTEDEHIGEPLLRLVFRNMLADAIGFVHITGNPV